MDVYKKSARLARQFARAYPTELSERLEWWSTQLGIERPRFLRLLGLSAQQAAQAKTRDLKEILKDPSWEANAWGLEGNLVRLIAFFSYDPRALVKYLQQPVVPSEQAEPLDVLVRHMHKGGGDGLIYLILSLIAARNSAVTPCES